MKKYYDCEDGKKCINITASNNIFINALSILQFLSDDLESIDKRMKYVIYSVHFAKYLCRFVKNPCDYDDTLLDKKVKEWLIRNYKGHNGTNRKLNKMIRNNYRFVYRNEHTVMNYGYK